MSRPLAYEYTAPPLDENAAALTILKARHVPELAELHELRRKGWRDAGLDGHFQTQRKVADQSTHASEVFWFEMMKKGMKEIDDAVSVLPSQGTPFEFLDIWSVSLLLLQSSISDHLSTSSRPPMVSSCCPGGFSSFTLNKKRLTKGVGLSLPASSGGHSFMLENYLRPRYQLIEKDILEYNLAPNVPGTPFLTDMLPDALLERFQLVFIDGHALRTYASLPVQGKLDDAREAHVVYRDSLHIAHLIIALECVRPGGTISTRLSHPEAFPASHILYFLDQLSDELAVYKPRTMHTYRGTFYVVAKGVCRRTPALTELKARYLTGLQQLWSALRWGGPSGRGRRMSSDDLDFIVSTEEILGRYLDRLIELGRPVWRTQAQGLHRFFAKKGIE
uniref:3-phosphoshikimate 1-carboxyvinyltransferase (EPSP synthase) (EPSPS)) n=1 Tax=Ganoderma boninense TaxID=34458 RepID=A0A5K1K735_9APHY|nr:3-phosphoshikimate 1-carboxyvinyltransferase (EC (5-enolpyruvylshikimate-3-phosphate synthase) (EPSP synthase) (EPSPS) [Ganoderma boninense]